jgi:SAM-dependent methyltransferase
VDEAAAPGYERADWSEEERSMMCRVCDATTLELVLDLGMHPWANHFLKIYEVGTEPFYPLRVVHCQRCKAAQLDYTVKKEVMFSDHTYLSGITSTLRDHFREVATDVRDRFMPDPQRASVLDIGSNDGTQLLAYQEFGCDVLGVESSRTAAAIATEQGVPTVNSFFNAELAQTLGGKFTVINASGVFFHLEELHSVTDGIRRSLADDGVFVVQFLYMKEIVANGAFDQIYHEHLLYYNLETIAHLLERHGLELFDAYVSPIHGGSVIAFIGHRGTRPASPRLQHLRAAEKRTQANDIQTYLDFARRTEAMKEKHVAFLSREREHGRTVFGLGAPVKGNTLLNYFGVTPGDMECLVERNVLRRGLFSPGAHIPIVIEDELSRAPDTYYVLAWNFKREILARYADAVNAGVNFHFPVEQRL